YREIMEKPYDMEQQIQLAKDVFDNIYTSELPSTNSTDEIHQTYSGGGKSTMTLPWDCVSGVNKVLEKYGLSNKLKVNYKGSTIIGGHKNEYLDIITSHIDRGIPVAVYTGIGTGRGPFSKHYFNAYKYEKYVGVDANKNTIEKYAIRACLNLQDTDSKGYYFDAELLDSAMCGVVYIDPVYSHNELLTTSNFSSFVNDNNQGQYFFEKKTAQIVTDSGYTFGTVRLRCGYIENKYLVLSANRENAGTAYLEFHLDEEIKGFEFDASLWSLYEDLTEHDMFSIEYLDGQNWVSHVRFDIPSMSPIKINPKSYNVLFNKGVTSFRFYLRKNMPSGDRNKGRVVLNNIHLHFN
ncbi:MAG: hypothetical protein K2N65_00090, partial [Anaeroplasmataceae bacterium]|nr:hypothetical protein [Anaeroplasmataceae bacterium]